MIERIVKALRASETIMIVSHISPDGDTCACGLALMRALENIGKSVRLFCQDKPSGKLQTMPGADRYEQAPAPRGVDLAIAVDCGDPGRLGDYWDAYRHAKVRVNIDHHRSNPNFGSLNYVRPTSAASESVYLILKELDRQTPCLDKTIAQLLYTGIVTDSGGFTFSYVTPQTHRIAAELTEFDIPASEICDRFLKETDPKTFALRNRVLSKTKFYADGQVGIICFMQEDFDATDTNPDHTNGIINAVRDVRGVRVAVSITQDGAQRYKISIRTDDSVDASRIAMTFGGGGHKNAAGCRLQGYFEDVSDKLVKACTDPL